MDCGSLAGGSVLRKPVGRGDGYWVGAPTVFRDPVDGASYLTYRIRRPRGVEPDRGGEARIARAETGFQFEDIFALTKDQIGTASIERCYVHHAPDGQWRYFVSYVDPSDGRWCVSMMKADTIDALEPDNLRPLWKAADLGLEGVKDPWIAEIDGRYCMFLSIALSTAATSNQSHDTLDIYNTGHCVSASALATASDLDHWTWEGIIFRPEASGWDCYCRRINSVVSVEGRFVAFYDGSVSHHMNYEETTGLAVSDDLRSWQTLTPEGPVLTSPHASGSLRYVDAQEVGGRLHIFYEFAREDGAHDLRVIEVAPCLLGEQSRRSLTIPPAAPVSRPHCSVLPRTHP